jgi:hypothetical protein
VATVTDHRARAPQPPPILGPAIARNCTRWLGDHPCSKPAVRHVIWDETMENGFVCQEHLGELGTRWTFLAAHEVGPDCAMPGALFFEEENACRCPDELLSAPEEVEYAVA